MRFWTIDENGFFIKREMTISDLIDKAAAELVEQILEESRRPTGTPWFVIVRAKMASLVKDVKEKRRKMQ